jgi:hypothetical protein
VRYLRLRGRPVRIELGILRLRDARNVLSEHFSAALHAAARASVAGA